MVGFPVIKLCFLAVRQVTRPLAKRVVEHSKTGASRRVCIILGTISLGISGSIMDLARQEEIKAAQDKAKQKEIVVPPATVIQPAVAVTISKDKTAAARVASPRSRSLLQSLSYGPLPREKYDPTVFLDPGRSTGEAVRVFIQYPYRSMWEIFRKRFLAPYPEEKLVDAGAELLLELMAFCILAVVLSYEVYLQIKTTQRKEELLYGRIEALERRVAAVEVHNGLHFNEVPRFNTYELEEVVRYPRTKNALRNLSNFFTSLRSKSSLLEPVVERTETLQSASSPEKTVNEAVFSSIARERKISTS